MPYFCIILVVVLFIMCILSAIVNSILLIDEEELDVRKLSLFSLFKTIVTIITTILLLFVFGNHLKCNAQENNSWGTWEIIQHTNCQNNVEKSK